MNRLPPLGYVLGRSRVNVTLLINSIFWLAKSVIIEGGLLLLGQSGLGQRLMIVVMYNKTKSHMMTFHLRKFPI